MKFGEKKKRLSAEKPADSRPTLLLFYLGKLET